MKLSKEHENVLADLAGRLSNGKPKLRIVTPTEAVRPHGILKGKPKYPNPETGKQMPFLILEQWYPPSMLGEKENWNEEFLGIYPAECSDDCCNNGFWGLRSPLTNPNGEYIPFSERMMESIKRRQYIDIKWAEKTDTERLDYLEAERATANSKKAEAAWEQQNLNRDHYLNHKTEEDNADNRVFSFGEKHATLNKGAKEPIGSPLKNL